MEKYLVTYSNGKTQTVNGPIQLFSDRHVSVTKPKHFTYLNASLVLSIIPYSEEGKEV